MIKHSCKCRVYPNKSQEEFFKSYLGIARFIYNQCLSEITHNYRIAKQFNTKAPNINRSYLYSILKYLKESYPFIRDYDQNTVEATYDPLIRAFKNFFEKNYNYPKFKSRKNQIQTVKINNSCNRIRITKNKLYWNTFGYITLHGLKPNPEGRILNIRIKLENSRWFIIINYESPQPEAFKKTNNNVGIDLGIKTLMTLSDSTAKVKLQLDDVNDKIKKAQRILERRKYGSKNYYKALKKLHKHLNRKNNLLNDYYHKLSREIVEKYDVIKMETLGIKEMLQNSLFSRNIHEVHWLKL